MTRRRSHLPRFILFVIALALLGIAGNTWLQRIRGVDLPEGRQMTEFDRWLISTYIDLLRSGEVSRPASSDPTPRLFVVSPGESVSSIAQRLEAQGLIRDANLFRLYVRMRGLDATLRAGSFTLRPNMSIEQIALALQRSAGNEVQVTIPEGKRREEIADLLEQQVGISADEFRALTSRASAYGYTFLQGLPPDATLEGFLFPDTYRLPENPTAQDAILRMLDAFGQKAAPLLEQARAQGKDPYDVLIVASIVEREAVIGSERPLIASVYWNRLRIGQPLQADPTTQYALGYQPDQQTWWKRGLTLEDLRYADPAGYNTYVNPALPPGPIASPGLSSIEAALRPAETNFFYFVASCNGDGTHQFSVTFAEHQSKLCR
ncbi:MAG: endolytic transglycosylase MltG [Anaerolineae bacterium]|nr:endolytic transglycosylase MltG [Thermoflexales bacterium]MDW8394628.1 endolytic transglycosylase MltG [Anaerolineae bacterium]